MSRIALETRQSALHACTDREVQLLACAEPALRKQHSAALRWAWRDDTRTISAYRYRDTYIAKAEWPMQHFLRACGLGDLKLAQYLHTMNNFKWAEFKRHTHVLPLRRACRGNHPDVVKYLCTTFKLTAADILKNDLFAETADVGNHAVVRTLCTEVGLTAEDFEIYDTTAFSYACTAGHLDTVKLLQALFRYTGDELFERTNPGFWYACKEGHLGVVKYLCEEWGVYAELLRLEDCTSLCIACRNGHLDVVKYLCEEGGLVPGDVYSAFIEACTTDRLEVVKYLHKWAALTRESFLPDIRGLLGNVGGADVLKYLHMEFGLNAADAREALSDLLWRARGKLAVVEYLHREFGLTRADFRLQGAAFNRGCERCSLALYEACEYGYYRVVKYLCEEVGLNVEDIRVNDYAVFKASYRGGCSDITRYLYEYFTEEDEVIRSWVISRGLK